MKAKITNPHRVVTGIVRFSYMHIWKPSAINEGDTPKYGSNLLIPKSDTVTVAAIQDAINKAIEDGKREMWGGKLPPKLESPLRDGDVEKPDSPEYANCWFINPKSKSQPGIVDTKGQTIIDQDEAYSGCYGRASIGAYAFDVPMNKGIALYLNHVMITKKGEPLGSAKSKPEDDFAAFVGEEVDDMLA